MYEESWHKSERVTKKVPTPRTSEPLAFDEKSTLNIFALFYSLKRASLYTCTVKESKKIKVDFSSKANGSNVHYFVPPILVGTVQPHGKFSKRGEGRAK
jgi:hypothetical protein